MTPKTSSTLEEEIALIIGYLSRLSGGPVQIKAEFWSRDTTLKEKDKRKSWMVYLGRFEMSEYFATFEDLKRWYLKQAGKTKEIL